jgi:hypothetical protein
VTALLAVGVSACGGDERPTDAAWRTIWEERLALVPTADAIASGGEDLCGDLVGRYRVELPALFPTPDPALDDVVREWTAELESLVFDCPDDPGELDGRLAELDVLAAEVAAGLAADEAG